MVRKGCCDGSEGIKNGPWSLEEDQRLITHIQNHGGHGNWQTLPKLAGINRSGKSCRLRWMNYLRPDIKRGKFTQEEEQIILNLHSVLGNKWSAIARQLPGRTDNEIKNFWNTHLKKKLIEMGFDPITHRPRNHISSIIKKLMEKENYPNPSWEEQALRLLQLQTLQYLQYLLQPPYNNYSLTNINPSEIEIINSLSFHGQNNNNNNIVQRPLGNDSVDDVLFSHLPSLEIIQNNTNYTNETVPLGVNQNNEGIADPNCTIFNDGPSPNTNNINCTTGDGCSSCSSFVGSSASIIWSDQLLLEYSNLFHDHTPTPPPNWL